MQKSILSLGGYEKNLVREIKKNNVVRGNRLPPIKKPGYNVSRKKQHRKGAETEERQKKLWEDMEHFGVAEYNEQLVGLKRIYKPQVELTRVVRKELKYMMDLKDENVQRILGVVHEPIGVFVVGELRHRGCLKDILENEDIEIDNVFLGSMVSDLVKGLSFIQHGPLKCHGRLKSTNCLVDSRWVLTVSGFDLVNFRQDEDRKLGEEEQCRKLLWTAPELLRDVLARMKGTQKGDIYALGIILHEMYGRKGPFGDELLSPIDIIHKVTHPKPDQPLCRPDMSVLEGTPTYMELAMQACWEESPDIRPSLETVKKKLSPILRGIKRVQRIEDNSANTFLPDRKTSVVENIITVMEKYSGNLENLVADRSNQLQEERKKTERLLFMMLPPSIAYALKTGQTVDPERYECVTIYFSDIAGFTAMSNESTPDQIVTFLNDLYSCFDAIINSYDVYKVETIGDAYMVVSGAPIRNGDNHAGEIASMSLSLLEAVNHFKIRHRPTEILKLRIGIHCGYALTGVVALKIHCSYECKQLLDRLGGYDIIERGKMELAPGVEAVTYWVVKEDLDHREKRIKMESLKFPTLTRRR